MTCKTCGRPAENGVATHWIGCSELDSASADSCEQDGCSEPKREGSGKGAKPKYCDDHSDPKNRK